MEGTKHKRIRYKIPSYRKVYSVYAYNKPKYGKIYRRLQRLALQYNKDIFYRVNPYNVLKLCYVYKKGCLQTLGDEKHIYRYKALAGVLQAVAETLIRAYDLCICPDVLRYIFKRTGIALYIDAEGIEAEYMPVYKRNIGIRLRANIELLRQLRKGAEVEEAVKQVNNKLKCIYADRSPRNAGSVN